MAFIDRLIEKIVSRGAQGASLVPDRPIILTASGRSAPMSSKPLTEDKIERMIAEIMPADKKRRLDGGFDVSFDYEAPHGYARVQVCRIGASLQAHLAIDDPRAKPARSRLDELSPPERDPEPAASPYPAVPEPAVEAQVARISEASLAEPIAHRERARRAPAPSRPGRAPSAAAAIDELLIVMAEEGCSDLHLTSMNPPLYRKDGDIAHLREMTVKTPEEIEALLRPITPKENAAEFESRSDTDFAYAIEGIGRFRVNRFMDRHGPGAVFRIIPSEILTAEKLNLPQHVLDLCWLSKGLVVVTGPTGSGKSTTLAAMIDYINRHRSTHILTIEDPIEFTHETKKALINQREVGVHTKSFKAALRAALREDPDIVLVGEMRDLETVEIAMETAETGHLVFGTLHTNTAPSTVDRIIDQFPADRQSQVRTMLSESLKAVIAQTLCKKIGGGRIAALETLICNHAISNLIREGKTFQIPSIMSTGKKIGQKLLNDALIELVRDRIVSAEEAYVKAVDKTNFKSALARENIELNLGG